MNRNTRWLAVVVGLAVLLGILSVSAQDRPGPRVPPRGTGTLRNADDGQVSTRPATPEAWRPAVRAAELRAGQEQQGEVRIAAQARLDVRSWNAWVTRMVRDGDLRLRRIQEDTILPGRLHERLAQYYNGIPVFGGEIARQTDGRVTLSIFGTVYAGIDLDVTPALSPEQAVQIFERETGSSPSPLLKAELMILPRDDGTFALTYRMTQFTGHELPVLFVSAINGSVELRYNNLQTQEATIGLGQGVLGDEKKFSGRLQQGIYLASDEMRPPQLLTFDLRGNLDRTYWMLWGGLQPLWSDVASDSDNHWTDGAVVDAHCYLGWTYDYLFKRFARRGLDGNDAPIRAIVHPVNRADIPWLDPDDYYQFVTNAFWCGAGCSSDSRGYLVFGEGNTPGHYDVATGKHFDYQSGAIDTVGHELTHALTQFTSNLTYRNESGALSEAFSDIMGTSVEFFYQQPGDGPLKADYLIAEDTDTAMGPGSQTGDRSLADPSAFQQRRGTPDPDHYSKRYVGPADNGGVHLNCTIVGHAFYLAIEGGTNRTSGLYVQGVGGANREQIERVFYRAFVYSLGPNSNFSAARQATIGHAYDLYGPGSPAYRAITQAWDAVGVF